MSKFDVCVLGLGYIGLPTAVCFAQSGKKVYGVDIDPKLIEMVQNQIAPIDEPSLQALLADVVSNKNLMVGLEAKPAHVFLIAVPTPFHKETKKPDLKFVKAAIDSISFLLEDDDLIIIESTSPVGTTRNFQTYMFEKRPELAHKIFFVYCPERVLPGNIIHELKNNSRVVGGLCEKATKKAIDLYATLTSGQVVKVSNAETAEFIKLIENSYRDVNIAFANELSIICEKIPVNVFESIEIANMHPRVDILQPGCGVGGHCIAVDPWFLIDAHPSDAKIIKTAREVNDRKPELIINKVIEAKKNNKNAKIICLGLTFKPNVADVRESPAMLIFNKLKKHFGNEVQAIDPNLPIDRQINELSLSDIENLDDILVLLVDHIEFRSIKPSSKTIIDTRGLWLNVG